MVLRRMAAAGAGVLIIALGGWVVLAQAQTPPASADKAADPPHNQKYEMRMLVWLSWATSTWGGILDGPAGQAEGTDSSKGHDMDLAGNIYWAESDSPVIRSYRRAEDRVITLAGSVRGLADGPLDRARFGGWAYNSTSLIQVSGDGKHLFIRDVFGNGQWRYLDLEAGTVTTLGSWNNFQGGYFVIVKDRYGDIYAFVTSGAEPPNCKGYKKLKVAPWPKGGYLAFDRYGLDLPKMKFYYHCRGQIKEVDLKTGQARTINATDPKARPINTTGPLETTTMLCPTGMSVSPTGRYVYVGQGDGSTCFRLDLEKKHTDVWGRLDGGGYGWREDPTEKETRRFTGATGWPAAPVFIPGGQGAWSTAWGIYDLRPSK